MRDGWRETALGQVSTATTSQVPAATSGLPYYGLEHFDSGSPRISRSGDSAAMDGPGVTVSPGDVLFSKLRPYLNKVAVAGESAVASTEVLVYRPVTTDLDASYLALLLRDARAVDYAVARSAGSRMPRTSAKVMAELPIALPPLDEQRRIVDLIAAVDDAVDAAEAEAGSLRSLLSQSMSMMIREGSSRVPFADVVTLKRGFDLPVQDRVDGDVVVMSSSGAHGSHDVAMADGPGVVTGRSGTIGEVHFVSEPFWPLNTTLWVSDFHGNDPRYVRYLLQTMDLKRHAGGSTVPSLNRNVLSEIEVSMPDVPEQLVIVAQLLSMEDAADAAHATAESLRTLRSNLLTVLLSGEHEIPSSYDALLGEVA